ncbi:hypothetical protein Y032_0003g1309 [Ancylostoma ceylanicum]|uniref:Uncharacterized protein n=1 Tax=Ancylostoma ceylanicum TaxID=53326 RepID=A0A016VX70_9BILA|nr:hypothetical protein Y032_0003g1309 [Ancylostoma ceylanicum]
MPLPLVHKSSKQKRLQRMLRYPTRQPPSLKHGSISTLSKTKHMLEDLLKQGSKPDRFHPDLPAWPLALPLSEVIDPTLLFKIYICKLLSV